MTHTHSHIDCTTLQWHTTIKLTKNDITADVKCSLQSDVWSIKTSLHHQSVRLCPCIELMPRFDEAKSIRAVFTTAGRVTEAALCDQKQTNYPKCFIILNTICGTAIENSARDITWVLCGVYSLWWWDPKCNKSCDMEQLLSWCTCRYSVVMGLGHMLHFCTRVEAHLALVKFRPHSILQRNKNTNIAFT